MQKWRMSLPGICMSLTGLRDRARRSLTGTTWVDEALQDTAPHGARDRDGRDSDLLHRLPAVALLPLAASSPGPAQVKQPRASEKRRRGSQIKLKLLVNKATAPEPAGRRTGRSTRRAGTTFDLSGVARSAQRRVPAVHSADREGCAVTVPRGCWPGRSCGGSLDGPGSAGAPRTASAGTVSPRGAGTAARDVARNKAVRRDCAATSVLPCSRRRAARGDKERGAASKTRRKR